MSTCNTLPPIYCARGREHANAPQWQSEVSELQAKLAVAVRSLAEAHGDNMEGYKRHRVKYSKVRATLLFGTTALAVTRLHLDKHGTASVPAQHHDTLKVLLVALGKELCLLLYCPNCARQNLQLLVERLQGATFILKTAQQPQQPANITPPSSNPATALATAAAAAAPVASGDVPDLAAELPAAATADQASDEDIGSDTEASYSSSSSSSESEDINSWLVSDDIEGTHQQQSDAWQQQGFEDKEQQTAVRVRSAKARRNRRWVLDTSSEELDGDAGNPDGRQGRQPQVRSKSG